MSLRHDLRHGRRIARAEFVRSVRGYLRNKRRLAGLAVALLFFGGNFLFALPTAYVLGLSARSADAIPYFAPAATAGPVLLVALATLRTLERIGQIDAADLVLTTVHPRAVVLGLVSAEIGRLALWFGIPVTAFATAFTLGLGAPSLLLSAALVAVPLVCWAAIWGYALGIGTLRLFRRLPSARRALKIGGLLTVAVVVVASQFVGQYLVREGTSVDEFVSALTVAPVVDYVALAFVGTPLARPLSLRAVIVLVGLLALTPVGLVVATRQASRLWFTDAPGRAGTRQPRTSSGWLAAPAPFAWRKTGRVAWAFLLRARRHPQELAHLVMILFFLGPLGTTVAQSSSDALGPLVAAAGAGFGTYLAGATFGLNPLGDDRPQMPLLLLTATDTRTLVRGRSLAGLAVGVPVAVLVPLASVLVGTAPAHAVGFAAAGSLMCLAAAAFAVGLGAAYPIYEEREFWGTETVVPSTLVMMGYIFVVGGGTVIGLVVTWYVLTGHLVLTPLLLAGLGVYLALTGGVSYGSYRYALRRYRRYTFD
ncbi:hypothetical protein [Haloplanus aerogenes]|uniref:ABC-2 type transport system permease protein n=1 Tax=Haloplanus aerogenes TaxID=660522 RepID=A0A3M0E5T1_9EURY|nr:hypothetical protein [Haloplanus aerogenes]AZH24745.1 hypothetical protein DU502_04805 [Haloplanus aerogenes]RMB23593.1 hypothetical protein ATH50_0813 [Haloplanus aerogenes]